MASRSSKSGKPNTNKNKPALSGSKTDPQLQNTTFVHAHPSKFRDVVQKLTGASTDPMIQNLSVTISPHPSNGKHNLVDIGPIRPSFKLRERKQISTRNLQLELNQNGLTHGESAFVSRKRVMRDSPVSTLDTFLAPWSPRLTQVSPCLEEEMAIANKGFYLHPTHLASRKAKPELLPLFPTSSNS